MLSIIIPVYNEERTISKIIDMVLSVDLPDNMNRQLIVVNDGSTDKTKSILDQLLDDRIIAVHCDQNKGKTGAIKEGLRHVSGDYVLIQDADLEYNPDNYGVLIDAMREKEADVIYGSRFLGEISNMTLVNRWANRLSNIVFNIRFRTQLTDINTCLKMIPASVFQEITIESERFGFEGEISAKLMRMNKTIKEVPIHYVARRKKDGKKINPITAIKLFWCILKY